MRARAMASSFADALDLGAPPRPPRPRPRPARVGPSAGPGLRVGTDRSGPGRRRPGRNRPGRGRQRARHRPRRPQCRRGRTHQHPRRRGHGPGGRAGGIGRVRGPRRLFSGRWCGTQGARRGARGRRQVHGGALLLRSLKCGWTTWKVIPRASVSSGSRRGGRRPHGSRRSCRSRGGTALARHHADPDPRATASGREGPNDDGGWPMRTSARPSFSWVSPRSHGPGAARWRPLRSTARTIRRRRERGPSQLPPLPHRPRITRTHTHPE